MVTSPFLTKLKVTTENFPSFLLISSPVGSFCPFVVIYIYQPVLPGGVALPHSPNPENILWKEDGLLKLKRSEKVKRGMNGRKIINKMRSF